MIILNTCSIHPEVIIQSLQHSYRSDQPEVIEHSSRSDHPEVIQQWSSCVALCASIAICSMALLRGPDKYRRQVWIGNIPEWMEEPQVLAELACYGVHPYRMVLRTRAHGQDRPHIVHLHTHTCINMWVGGLTLMYTFTSKHSKHNNTSKHSKTTTFTAITTSHTEHMYTFTHMSFHLHICR